MSYGFSGFRFSIFGFDFNLGSSYLTDYTGSYMRNSGYMSTFSYLTYSTTNYGTISTNDYSSSYTVNPGTISTYSYYSYNTKNTGKITADIFSCLETTNYGDISISCNDVFNLGNFTLIDNGVLNLNGLIIKANEQLEPAVKDYLEECGGKITQTNEKTSLNGGFKVNRAEARNKLPHLFSKYDNTKPGSEYISSNWFSSSYDRVSSKSKTSGAEKLWRFKPITVDYNINTATADVFKGSLLHAVVKCDFVPKVKFDVFSKAVITREFSTEQEGSLKTDPETNTTRNHALLKYLCNVLASKDVSDIEIMLGKPLLPKVETQNNGFGAWLQSGMGMFFSASPKIVDDIPNNVSKEELIAALHEVIDSISHDNFTVCAKIKESIFEDLGKVNCKFTQEEIDQVILPEIDSSINSLKLNVELASKYLEELEAELSANSSNNEKPSPKLG